jgi:hypothetical protein
VKILLSTTDLLPLTRRPWHVQTITGLPPRDRKSILDNELHLRGKNLAESQKAVILAAPSCGNPLFLVVLASELCSFGDFFQLDAKIAALTACSDTESLFGEIISRLVALFDTTGGAAGDKFVGNPMLRLFAALHASRHGLSEIELEEALGISQAAWTRLVYAMGDLIVERSGLYCLRRAQCGIK